MDKGQLSEILLSLLLGLGLIFTASPLILYWFIHGNYQRYIWIINGPYPFSHLGGGPFQLLIFLGLLAVGLLMIYIAIVIKGAKKRRGNKFENQ